MDPRYDSQEQQYPPQSYGPYPPPKKDSRKTRNMKLAVAIVACVLPTAIAVALLLLLSPTPGYAPSCCVVPTGVWGMKTPVSPTAYNVDFGKVSGEPMPMDLEIILIRNLTAQGTYVFGSNDDGDLMFLVGSGTDLCDIDYSDLTNNQKVNPGDSLILTHLAPRSDYQIKMIWAPTGDQITSTIFSLP
jgi:hypothetical protein